MKKTNHKLVLIVLLFISICTLSVVGVTYSKFVFKQEKSETINVPEYNHCLGKGITTLSDCILANEYDASTVDKAKTVISARTADVASIPTTDEGLYMASDDSGNSYYFRGAVTDNYVSYAGFIWRIVRINGDGSVRLIYSGTSTLDAATATTIGNTKYNSSEITDMTLLGYKYGLNQTEKTQSSATYDNIDTSKTYAFGSSMTANDTTKLITLGGNTKTDTWGASYITALIWSLSGRAKYTCWKETTTSTCNIVLNMDQHGLFDDGFSAPESITGSYTAYLSTNYAATLTNENSSTIKTTLDSWYETNILNKTDSNGKSFANYLADNKFCNDRALSSGDGNTLAADTVYASYNRNTNNKTPSLQCAQTQDSFSTNTSNGNGSLTYPIGLITADELAFSGVVAGTENSSSFLNTGVSYWTMSPGYFSVTKLTENNYIMNSTGTLTTEQIKNESAIRPVINLSKDVLITKGNGTSANPYQVSIN